MSSKLSIAISGKSGCGNTTVSRLVAAKLGLRVVNYTFKDLARDRGMEFDDLARAAQSDPQYDLSLDRMQVEMAKVGGIVLGSRLAIWLLRDTAFTVYMKASMSVRAARIARREGWSFAVAVSDTEERDRRDGVRFGTLYGYDVDDYAFASLVLDVESLDADGAAECIVRAVRKSTGPSAS
jgi:cytidylate kinase